MPFYVVDPSSLKIAQACERSPVVSLITDAKTEDEIPDALREASDRVVTGDLSWLRDSRVPDGCDAAILWIAGDQLLRGSGALIRYMVTYASRRTLVPVHLACLPDHDLDLVGLQPRIWNNGPNADSIQQHIRLRVPNLVPPEVKDFIEESPDYWARMYRALQAGQKNPEKGIDRLSKLWHKSSVTPPVYGALLVRNLIVLYVWLGRLQRIEILLKAGMDRYPRCAELPYMAGRIALQQNNLKEASRYAERSMENPDLSFVGSGGEGLYRSAWLAGLVAELEGKQNLAVTRFLPGLAVQPAFMPSVEGLMRQRLGGCVARSLSITVLPDLVRREPQYAEAVFHFLLLHRQTEAARRILELPQVPDELRQSLQKSLKQAILSCRPRPRSTGSKPGVTLTGPFYVHSSLARINRELGSAMTAATDIEIALEPHGEGDVSGTQLPHFDAISQGLKKQLSRLDLTIRLHWPPDFTQPPCGKLVLILPWEFGSVPCRWIKAIDRNVDELWALSQFNKESFVRAGISEDRVHVVPPGIDTETFNPEGTAWRPEGCRGFAFLFVGGAIPRKGPDILWNAYQSAFTSADDVTLVIKEMGAETFYKGQSLTGQIRVAAAKPRAPHVMVLSKEFDDAKLASLYRGSNVFVLPYRGEGFGMPLAEALACGKAVITTGLGPSREFCPPEASYFIPAKTTEIMDFQNTMGPMSGPFTWFEPDVKELAKIMRHVYEHQNEILPHGLEASEKIRMALSWDRITGMMLDRIRHLVDL
ncbi:MAG: glycosyltransferase [Terriglobia bacterium]